MNVTCRMLALAAFLLAVPHARAQGVAFDAGADLRIRQEIMDHIPGLPGGGVLCNRKETGYINHLRYRPRVWGETRFNEHFRLYLRLTDEMRQYVRPSKNAYTWPDEVIVDNLYLEGKGLWDGFLDFTAGRQDMYGLYGLDHVFVDGTPGDGSRSTYADMVRARLNFTEMSSLDLFGLFNCDDNPLRWGTHRGNHRACTSLNPSLEPDMDDWGFGAVWNSRLGEGLPYQAFVIEKNTRRFYDRQGVKHPRTRRELMGVKLMPRLTDEWSLQLEGMSEVGQNGEGAALAAWSGYFGVNWKSAGAATIKPMASFGYHFMSGDEDAAREDGGHSAWDPMWARTVADSEMFLYGTHYGAGWWSNMHYFKLTGGLSFGPRHAVTASCGPMFAAADDNLGGGDGDFKGFLGQARYEFPIWIADKTKGERLEVFGHVLGEVFNPGDYYASQKPGYFLRWQVEFRF